MLAKRIIPCLDVKDGKTVKGVNFLNLTDAGDPVALGKKYSEEGADELVFLDISASHERRATLIDLVKRVAENINIPFTVGGGISSIDDVDNLLSAGADKISINSTAVINPKLITDIANRFGSQVCTVAIDAKYENKTWQCYTKGGRNRCNITLLEWAKEAQERGAGEILFTSMDNDGVKSGFANNILSELSHSLSIPVIASGGGGTMQHFADAFTIGNADAALAASVFHFNEINIRDLKIFLNNINIPVRL